MRARWTGIAREDFQKLTQDSADYGPTYAIAASKTIDAALARVIEHPKSAPTGRAPDTREVVLRRLPYILVYRVDPGELIVLTIRRTARRWPDDFPA